jgi:hypothetical protein
MADLVPFNHYRIVQMVPSRLRDHPARIQRILMEHGLEHYRLLERLELREIGIETRARETVERERAEAVAAGCHVVIDEDLPEVFSEVELKDVEGRNIGG